MRVLYVALTRAKEKIIITAVKNDEQKDLDKKKEILEVYIKNKKINPILLKKYSSYIDWIELTYLKNKILDEEEIFKFNIIDVKDFALDLDEKIEEEKILDYSEYNNFEKLEEKLNWEYKDILKTKLPIKSTVSEIKRIKNNESLKSKDELEDYEKKLEEENEIQFLSNEKIGLANIVPEFLKDSKIDSSKIGTITHLVLQKMDFNLIKTKDDIKDFIQELVYKNFLSQEEAEKINIENIYVFLNSDFAKKIKKSKKIYKEKPFFMKIKAKEFLKESENEEILVQGIIDLYFENDDNNLILVDYKTDYLNPTEEDTLINKYKMQLELYKEALEGATNKKVSEVYIYSLILNKEIRIF